jgi:hypothetical protein
MDDPHATAPRIHKGGEDMEHWGSVANISTENSNRHVTNSPVIPVGMSLKVHIGCPIAVKVAPYQRIQELENKRKNLQSSSVIV